VCKNTQILNILIILTFATVKYILMTEVKFYDPSYEPDKDLTYSVISARYKNKWIFVRHHKRTTFEIAGGHIENGETSFEAAGRELMEETGALKFSLDCMATYSVKKDGETGWGRLYLAEVTELGPVPDFSEIAEVVLLDRIPEVPTHPDIQPLLFEKTLEYIKNRKGG
jgi:8-oxo-dGTP diphosphatase